MRCATRSIRARSLRERANEASLLCRPPDKGGRERSLRAGGFALQKPTPRCAFGSRPPYQGVKAMSLLEVKDLSIHFGRRKVVDNVSFSLDAGQKLALVGESASGKTVTALSTLRLIQDARLSGSIRFQGREVLTMPDQELRDMRGRDIAVIFQEPMTALNPTYTLGDQIVESLELHTPLRGAPAWAEAIAAM